MPPSPDAPRDAEFEDFYRRMAPTAARYARTILGGRARADLDDTLQSAWSNAWRAWDDADDARRDAWFLRIVRNACIDRHRRGGTAPVVADAIDAPAAEQVAVDRLAVDTTYALLAGLSPKLREALWLREVGGMSYADIAALQDVPVGTVMSRLYTARRRAARLLRGSR